MGLFDKVFDKVAQNIAPSSQQQISDNYEELLREWFEECEEGADEIPPEFMEHIKKLYFDYAESQKDTPTFMWIYEDLHFDFQQHLYEFLDEYIKREYADDPELINNREYREYIWSSEEEYYVGTHPTFNVLYDWVEKALFRLGFSFVHDDYSNKYIANPAQTCIFKIDVIEYLEELERGA